MGINLSILVNKKYFFFLIYLSINSGEGQAGSLVLQIGLGKSTN